MSVPPALSVIVPTFNNVTVLRQCLESWQRHANRLPVEVIVIEDGCGDETAAYLEQAAASAWGRAHLRWCHEDNAHELRSTNRGFAEARAPLLMPWQDDMFIAKGWLLTELVETFTAYPEIGMVSLSRGLNMFPVDEPIETWEQLVDWRRLQSTIGNGPANWFRLQEVDAVIRPWVVRRACLDAVGVLDDAFVPTEWDEADLCYRLRQAGWKVATHGYERLGAYVHLGSSTLATLSDQYKARVLRNGLLFHVRWDDAIRATHTRERATWFRRATLGGRTHTLRQLARYGVKRVGDLLIW
jgi:glycosyltransferase involved in cell wall biosynthesis